jgi:hypothetical protein
MSEQAIMGTVWEGVMIGIYLWIVGESATKKVYDLNIYLKVGRYSNTLKGIMNEYHNIVCM